MDPYLEGELFQEFHQSLAHEISKQLLELLSPKYVALLSRRYVIDRTPLAYEAQAMMQPAARLPRLGPEEVPVMSVEVRDVAERRLVTVIEILSPVNKQGDGAVEYRRRRQTIFETETHILEIDLLRRGLRLPFESDPLPADYYVFLSRVDKRPRTEIWPIGLRDRLPVVPVPVLPPDADVPLDLQQAVDGCYDLVHYERLLDYTVPPLPPALSEGDAVWLAERLVVMAGSAT
jgi:hypothetical protein